MCNTYTIRDTSVYDYYNVSARNIWFLQSLDFWKDPSIPGRPVDIRVPPLEMETVKGYLSTVGLTASVMIQNVQE